MSTAGAPSAGDHREDEAGHAAARSAVATQPPPVEKLRGGARHPVDPGPARVTAEPDLGCYESRGYDDLFGG
ncbi:MAG TPA: hypothetical protein VGP16_35050, partial [Asanoa sp.]|nr:hypothetical protein [Asanoa sp.]